MSFHIVTGIGLLVVFIALLAGTLPRWSYDKGWLREPSTIFGGFLMILLIMELLAT